MPDAELYVLQLDIKERRIRSYAFTAKKALEAQQKYAELEAKSDPQNVHTVLVSVDSFASLRKAYPSFYLDISGFIGALKLILSV